MKKFVYFGIIFCFALFLIECTKKINESIDEIEPKEEEVYDVIVIGTEPEGIMAAVSSAREGQKTLLISEEHTLGGLFTIAKLNMIDLNYAPDGSILNEGLFAEFYEKINKRSSFDVEEAKQVFHDLVENEQNITLELNAKNIEPIMNEKDWKMVNMIHYENKTGEKILAKGNFFIDATADAEFAYLAGAEFTLGQEDFTGEREFMSITPIFEVSGVNWEELRTYLREDGNKGTAADKFSAWGLSQETKAYKSENESLHLRGLNIGRQNNGNVLINAFLIRGVNPLDEKEMNQARKWAEEEIPKVVDYLKNNIAGFQEAELVGIAEKFYVRETRHLIGEYRMTIDDVLENRDFFDRIAFGSYSVDIQGTKSRAGTVLGQPEQYAVPFRSIVPKGYKNLLVASRSASYDSLAHGSVRVVPIGMNVGQSAGIISAYANEQGLTHQEIIENLDEHVEKIHERLNRQDMNLHPIESFELDFMNHWSYEGLKTLRSYGIVSGGYRNEYRLEEEMKKQNFHNYVSLLKRTDKLKNIKVPFEETSDFLTNTDVLWLLEVNNIDKNDLSEETKKHIETEYAIKRGTFYMILHELLHLEEKK